MVVFKNCIESCSNAIPEEELVLEEIKSDEELTESQNELSVTYGDPEVVKEQPKSTSKRNDYALSDFIDMKEYCERNSAFHKFRAKLDWPRCSMMFATLFLEFWERFSAEEWTEFETMVAASMREIDDVFLCKFSIFSIVGSKTSKINLIMQNGPKTRKNLRTLVPEQVNQEKLPPPRKISVFQERLLGF